MSFLNNILVFDTEHTKVRVGDKKDGGYVVLEEVSLETEILYSYGVEYNSSFEGEFVKRFDCDAVLFDHTVDAPAETNERFTFVKEGLSDHKHDQFDTLNNHLTKFGDPDRKTLKMDIEWSEWDVFEEMSEFTLSDFDQILVELHMIPVKYKDSHSPYFTGFHQCVYEGVNNILFERYQRIIDKLQQYYYVYHVHINNSIPCNQYRGEDIPPLLELSLVNKSLVKEPRLTTQTFPVDGLDYPNKTDRPDITHIEWNQ